VRNNTNILGETMKETKLICNKKFRIGKVDPRIFGSFIEHMGRVVYSGIYEPEHPLSDNMGFRTDVLKLVSEMGVTAVRYPGGNFVSNYDWRDAVGPLESRPTRLNLPWHSTETNRFGINEFIEWSKKADVQPIFTVNLGTKGIENALSFLEYCNHPKNSFYSDLRRKHGIEEPYNIRTWCLGNEMDGDWQIGHKTADEYGRLAQETAKAMKMLDPTVELVLCGSSKSSMETFPDWELITLNYAYNYVDYIAVHQYYGGQEKGTPEFLAQSLDMERYLKTVRAACDLIQVKKHSPKVINISVDEWGVWELPSEEVDLQLKDTNWDQAPAISEQIYTMEDSLLFASMMLTFLKNADRVKIACQSLLTNISACIMTERNGNAWVQPIFYPFSHIAKFGKGEVLNVMQSGPSYETSEFKQVPYVDSVAVYHEDSGEVTLFLVNRCENEKQIVSCELENFNVSGIVEHIQMFSDDKKATNLQDHNRIRPDNNGKSEIKNGMLTAQLEPLSWNVIRIQAE